MFTIKFWRSFFTFFVVALIAIILVIVQPYVFDAIFEYLKVDTFSSLFEKISASTIALFIMALWAAIMLSIINKIND